MKKVATTAALIFVTVTSVFAAPQTWTGKISDSMCGLTHKAMIEHDKKLTDRTCTEACVKTGAKYVFASGGKVYMIENQSDPLLAMHAGHTVRLTGEMKGDTVTVSKIVMPASKKAAKKS